MVYDITNLTEAYSQALAMPWAYVATDSQLTMGPAPMSVDWSRVLDARFFGPSGEFRIFRQNNSLCAVWIDDTPCPGQLDTIIDRTVELNPQFGSFLRLRQHIVFDEDGQACVHTTRLLSWEGGTSHAAI